MCVPTTFPDGASFNAPPFAALSFARTSLQSARPIDRIIALLSIAHTIPLHPLTHRRIWPTSLRIARATLG